MRIAKIFPIIIIQGLICLYFIMGNSLASRHLCLWSILILVESVFCNVKQCASIRSRSTNYFWWMMFSKLTNPQKSLDVTRLITRKSPVVSFQNRNNSDLALVDWLKIAFLSLINVMCEDLWGKKKIQDSKFWKVRFYFPQLVPVTNCKADYRSQAEQVYSQPRTARES